MVKKIGLLGVGFMMLVHLCGCVAVVAGAAAGAGTAVWYQGKLSQEVGASYEKSIAASRKALTALNLPVNKETRSGDIAQIKSTYTDGKEIWIDVRRISEKSSRVDVRVGGVEFDRMAADKILQKIQASL